MLSGLTTARSSSTASSAGRLPCISPITANVGNGQASLYINVTDSSQQHSIHLHNTSAPYPSATTHPQRPASRHHSHARMLVRTGFSDGWAGNRPRVPDTGSILSLRRGIASALCPHEPLALANLDTIDGVPRLAVAVRVALADAVDHIHATTHLAKDTVLAVEVWRRTEGDEEL
jgi:hypothetical protein